MTFFNEINKKRKMCHNFCDLTPFSPVFLGFFAERKRQILRGACTRKSSDPLMRTAERLERVVKGSIGGFTIHPPRKIPLILTSPLHEVWKSPLNRMVYAEPRLFLAGAKPPNRGCRHPGCDSHTHLEKLFMIKSFSRCLRAHTRTPLEVDAVARD